MVAYNIIFAGESGSGKSSLINLLVEQEVSKTSNDAVGVTDKRERYIAIQESDVDLLNIQNIDSRDTDVYRLWDTPGFNEGTQGTVSPHKATKTLKSLTKELSSGDGVHLLVFCCRFRKRITGDLRIVYHAVVSSIHCNNVPVVAAVTHADEMLESPEVWWEKTRLEREQKGMAFRGYKCVSTLKDGDFPVALGRRKKARDDMWQLIKTHAIPLSTLVSQPDLTRVNIILFGQTGVGKSSVVNLVAGRHVADVSSDVTGCTMKSTEYQFIVGAHHFRIWDTIGLEEPKIGANAYFSTILKALQLIRMVAAAGGVNLLLFCLRGNRLTSTVQSNYRLFYEMFCAKKVPVGLVITHLEREGNMEDWWSRNENVINTYGMKNIGHACVTGLADSGAPEKYALSRAAIYGLLTDCDRLGMYTMPPENWL
ncbi:hypothetical protein ID866_4851, partial [Astraeus odoratus]